MKETAYKRKVRLENARVRRNNKIASESPDQRLLRLEKIRIKNENRRIKYNIEKKRNKISLASELALELAETSRNSKNTANSIRLGSADHFHNSVNTFCDKVCEICRKQCYPHQVLKFNLNIAKPAYLPRALVEQKQYLSLCYRCNSHLSKPNNMVMPSKAYWNHMEPGTVPDVLQCLSQTEKRLLSRIIPFIKIVKFDGRFGQFGFRGQAVLFAQDIFEFSENLPNMLPRSVEDCGIVIVTEYLENLEKAQEFSINRNNVLAALHWLVKNNPLYKDVIVDDNVEFRQDKMISVCETVRVESQTSVLPDKKKGTYLQFSENSSILRGSWHQGNVVVFTSGFAGVQCCAMAMANIIKASLIPPHQWTTLTVDEIMLEGDRLYKKIHQLSTLTASSVNIDADGYLELRHFDVVRTEIQMFNETFEIAYDIDTEFYGNLKDSVNNGGIGKTLKEALSLLLQNNDAAILIASGKSFGILYCNNNYFFTDSHSCGPKGARASNGKACVIRCGNIDELVRICKRATGSKNSPFTLNYVVVRSIPCNTSVIEERLGNQIVSENPDYNIPMNSEGVNHCQSIHTSVMAPIDYHQPDVEEELEISDKNRITRKNKDNIVNSSHEEKAEELSWFYLFPYGINGLRERTRMVPITPLDYFQFRIMGNDTRFQKNEYLFYALSMFELQKIKSTLAACGKKIAGENGMVEDIHLYLKNLRGSAAYWRAALNDLVAQIKCLGPPSFFLTFSCNDLHWMDMRKALLVADGRPHENPSLLDVMAVQKLVELYPVVVSRHFMVRVNALMTFLRHNHQVLGGEMKDFWWRIEFQNRGSPHLHMVVWIDGHPEFDTEEGIRLLERTITCELPPINSDLYGLVTKNQTHRHTKTCLKNNAEICRFGFPRQESNETKIIAHTSNEFLKNGGRLCILKRSKEEKWINNYNPTLLRLWSGNMDIQPCGSNDAIAYYVAKYISKSEPTTLDYSIAQAVRQIQREESNVSRKLFKICMRIMQERQVSACECAFRLCHLKLRDASRNCIFLNTRKPEQRYRVIKFNDTGLATGYCNNIFDRYEKRPSDNPDFNFEDMCLLEFAMRFEPYYDKKKQIEELNEDDEEQAAENNNKRRKLLKLLDNSRIVERSTPAVVRVPYFVATTQPEFYFYSLLLQYVPFRNESELLVDGESAQTSFLRREEMLQQSNTRMQLFRERDKQLENAFNQAHAFQILDDDNLMLENEPADDVEVLDEQMKPSQFQKACEAMNLCQKEVFHSFTRTIRDQLNGSSSRMRLFITGNAGTGKTFLFKLLKNQANRCHNKIVVKVCALTGVAARLVGGSTLHSSLKLPVQKDGRIVQMPMLTGNYLRLMRLQWREIEFLFIDEISMVPYEMLCMIDSRLKQLKNSDDFFGGLNILLFGDLMQLPPVRGSQVFQQPSRLVPATHLWRLFSLIELKENMRQKGSNTFVDILNALRVGELTAEHFSKLMTMVSTKTVGEFSIEKALRIYPTNQQVDDHNKAVLKHFKDRNTHIITIVAQDKLIDCTKNHQIDMKKIIPSDINKTGGLPHQLDIFVGAKVMLRSNIDVSKGLVNGAIGHIDEIIWPHYRRGQLYETDIPTVKIDFGVDGIHLIKPLSIQFPAKFNFGTAERRMLPLVLSWASTVHKMQGTTVDHAVIYLGPKLFAMGQAYVALSRVRSLEGLQIEELDNSKLTGKKPCNIDALNEIERMRKQT